MIWQDLVNATFEGLMAPAVLASVVKLWRDKRVLGYHWFTLAVPTTWGFWNLYYYPWLGQPASFWAGLAVVSANTVFLSMLIYYLRRPGGRKGNVR